MANMRKNRKKVLLIGSAGFLVLFSLILFFVLRTGKRPEGEHVCTYSGWILDEENTCQQAGSRHRECTECGRRLITEILLPRDHVPVKDTAKEADCTHAGRTEGTHCSVCGEILTAQKKIRAKGHVTVTDEAVPADCTHKGLTEGSHCEICGTVFTPQKTVPMKGHVPVVDEGTGADCTHEGKTEGAHCSVCGKILTAQEILPAKGHTVVTDPGVAGDGNHPGLTRGTHCSVCGEILVPQKVIDQTVRKKEDYKGKKLSILGDSISSMEGFSNDPERNSTIGENRYYYSEGTYGVHPEDTWWMQVASRLDMELLVNNSWSGACIYPWSSGTYGAYRNRCQQLHNDKTGETPDVILVFLGTNDFTFYPDSLGSSDIDYGRLIRKNGTSYKYAEPKTSCEAYAILLHKISVRYPNARVFCIGLLPRRDPDYPDEYDDPGQPTSFNRSIELIATRFGAFYVDLESSAVRKDADVFDRYIGDRRVHPTARGMDKITDAVIGKMVNR